MAGLPDILSAYREGLASERQFRTSQMQMSLSQLQYESERAFREEGRRREDAFRGLTLANQTMKESQAKDASSIYLLMRSLDFIDRDSDGKINKLKLNKAKPHGFSDIEAQSIYNMVLMYESESPVLQQQAQFAATNIGKLVSAYKDSWVSTGKQPDYLKALSKAGILYAGDEVDGEVVYDETKFDLSYEPFVNVSKATDVLANISDELGEMARGDYEIQRGIGIDRKFTKQQSSDDVASRMADIVEANLDKLETDLDYDDTDSEYIDSVRELRMLKSLVKKGYGGFDDDIKNLTIEIGKHKENLALAKENKRVAEIKDMMNYIFETTGMERTSENEQLALGRALDLLGSKGYQYERAYFLGQRETGGDEDRQIHQEVRDLSSVERDIYQLSRSLTRR